MEAGSRSAVDRVERTSRALLTLSSSLDQSPFSPLGGLVVAPLRAPLSSGMGRAEPGRVSAAAAAAGARISTHSELRERTGQ